MTFRFVVACCAKTENGQTSSNSTQRAVRLYLDFMCPRLNQRLPGLIMSKLITSFHAELNEASYSGSIPREWRVANEFERILGGASLRALPRMPFWNSPCTAFIPLHLQFTIDNRQDLWYGCACYLEQTRRHAAPLTPLDSALPRTLAFCTILVQISRSESALTDPSLVTPLECTLTKTPGEGVSPPSSVPCCVSVVNPLLSSVCSLFALFLRPPSFLFSNLEPLSAKHPGCGGADEF